MPFRVRISNGYIALSIFEHVFKAEKALGHDLPDGAVVHHVDYCKTNNNNTNLVVCQDRAYHQLLHVRTDAIRACGNVNWRKCMHCGVHDDIDNMKAFIQKYRITKKITRYYHRECAYKVGLEYRNGTRD